MLVPGRALAEPAIVGKIEQRFRALQNELSDEARKHRFVTNKGSDAVTVFLAYDNRFVRLEIARLRRDFLRQCAQRPWHEFAERNQVYLVVTADFHALRRPQHGRV